VALRPSVPDDLTRQTDIVAVLCTSVGIESQGARSGAELRSTLGSGC
jgi:hypothetical protein